MSIAPNEVIDLERFIQRLKSEADMFLRYWQTERTKLPANFPLEMPYNEWHEQFAFFDPPDLKTAEDSDDND